MRPLEKELLAKSGLLRCLYSIWLDSPNYAKLEPLVFPNNEIQVKNLNDCQGEVFINNLSSLINLCLAKRVTFAYLPFTYAPIGRMKSFHGTLAQAIYDFEKRLTAKAKKLIQTYNTDKVCFFDYNNFEFIEKYFFDSCHMLAEGESRKSEIVAERVINLLKVN